ncbi:thymocyte nuclear protein 1 isoform X2 [Gopherus evgoodei]|uniref:thymocyte nuclear protein 1 isoform X2 n=1 Tax=Gopherus evgoodei TaxID=1825980 RepID=UPI0011CF4C4C|nr:thymocyte nuclear protein 1 isoform X2 [Gopherus evgoodei]
MSRPGKKRSRATLPDKEGSAAKFTKSKTQEEEESMIPAAKERNSKPVGSGTGKTTKETCPSAQGSKQAYSHWLMKSEPESRFEKGVDVKARNFMRDMKVGQEAFFYHSNCKEPGIAGIIKIVKEAYPDHTQFDKKDPHYDSSSTKENPKWSMVDVQFERMTKRFIPLSELKAQHQAHRASGGPLKDMTLFTRQRLSVQPLTDEEFEFVLSLEEKPS